MHTDALTEKTRAATASLLAAIFLTAIKLAVGLYTNSLGLLSEAMHSGLDLVAAGMTLFAVRIASRPADSCHPYGHGKIENLSALLETALLLITCGWILGEAIERLFFEAKTVLPSLWGVGIMSISIVIDVNRSRMLKKLAKKHKSQALEADALHFESDIWSSAVVLIGLLALWLAQLLPPQFDPYQPMIAKADAVAALIVSCIVLKASFSLAKKSVNDLLDGSSEQDRLLIEEAVASVPGLSTVRRARIRNSGPQAIIDLVLTVDPHLRIEAGHHVAHVAEQRIQQLYPQADVTVHVEPSDTLRTENPVTLIQNAAATHKFSVHGLQLFARDDSSLRVELHAEMPKDMSLNEAHLRVTEFETFVEECLPGLEIVTHMEVQQEIPDTRQDIPVSAQELAHIETCIVKAMQNMGTVSGCHRLQAYTTFDEGDNPAPCLSFHCRMDGATLVQTAHDAATSLEQLLRLELPNLGRIVIHMEPIPTGTADTQFQMETKQ